MIKPFLYLKKTANKGRAVFTKEKIPANTIIEESPVIIMSKEERVHLDKTLLHDYIFEWGNEKDKCCVALGYIPIYNHSYKSNCEYYMDFEAETIQIKSIKAVESEEELTINYNGDWNNNKKIWFEVKV
ncbi:MAG: SET domain-containing protein-lysine N-methyltransferase [Chitinophagaceae bacterium]|nr:SET domain-containing protein-lysine N-methyltransferase [Chitinophagaceae bacterium]